jgi:hypothetical protein
MKINSFWPDFEMEDEQASKTTEFVNSKDFTSHSRM